MSERRALVAGGGGSSGPFLCRALRKHGYRVVCAGRSGAALHAEVGEAADDIVEVELTSEESVRACVQSVGAVEAMVYNAGRLDLAPILDTSAETFTASWQANALGAFLCARHFAPMMIERGRGSMIFVGATASVRGGARTHAFASAKHAQRGLAYSLAKELGPRGVHVAHLVIDGKVWGRRTRERFPGVREDECLQPADVAAAICALLEQPRSAWTFEMDLRPSVEKWR